MNAIDQHSYASPAGLRCLRCSSEFSLAMDVDSRGCPSCSSTMPSNLRPFYRDQTLADPNLLSAADDPSMWRYRHRLPEAASRVSLGEGRTPLLKAFKIGTTLGVPNLLIKDEGRNPTWSYKDRFSSVAVSRAKSQGARVVATASSGNAGASLAAYAARAGLQCVVVTFAGSAGPMLSQIKKYGGIVLPMINKADRWELLDAASKQHGWFVTSPFRAPVVGSHPIGIEGYKTIAYELVEQCGGEVPDWCVMPVCYGDGMSGIWSGFEELMADRVIDRAPKLVAAEVHGSLADALARDLEHPVAQEMQFESLAISIGAPCSTYQALRALRESGGKAVKVSNDGLIEMQEELARREGIFAELAAVTPLIAIDKLSKAGVIQPHERVVALVTASGLKDLDKSTEPEKADRKFSSSVEALSWLNDLNDKATR